MLSKMRLWVRGNMPSVRSFEDERIRIEVTMEGIRKFILLRWLPYLTFEHPRISLCLFLKDPKFKIRTLSIQCDPPKHREDRLFDPDFGWHIDSSIVSEAYHVRLPELTRDGKYEYQVNVGMTYQYDDRQDNISSIGTIINTGKVLDRGLTILGILISLVSLIIGALLDRFLFR